MNMLLFLCLVTSRLFRKEPINGPYKMEVLQVSMPHVKLFVDCGRGDGV